MDDSDKNKCGSMDGQPSCSCSELTAEESYVLKEKGTERAFSSPLNNEKRDGSYLCKSCGELLFSSEHKYNSGSGWPSFFMAADDSAIGTSVDYDIGYKRVEIHCENCSGHLGHVFDDGPKPTGQRYCVNGLSLVFKAD